MPATRSRLGRRAGHAPIAALLLAGCTLGPNYRQPVMAAPAPASWTGGAPPADSSTRSPTGASAGAPADAAPASRPVAEPVAVNWWESFGDATLTGLVARAARDNLDVAAAVARLEQSRAQLRIAGADRLPTVNADASYTRQRLSPQGVIGQIGGAGSGGGGQQAGVPTSVAGPVTIPAFNLWQYGFDASWEPDLWGRARRSVESARASSQAQREDLHDVLLSTAAEVARDYLQLRGAQTSLRIVRESLAAENEIVAVSAERERRGLVSGTDEQQARAQAEATAALIPQLEQQQGELINALSLLVGDYPQALRAELQPPASLRPAALLAAALPSAPPRVPVGLPSELVGRRPDIREASARLHAATANVGVAKADFLPRLTLTGNFDIQSTKFRGLDALANRTFGVGPGLSLPIFRGGRLRGTLALREAELRESATDYRKTVLSAFRDVADAFTAFDAEQRRRDRLAAAATASEAALGLSNERYRRGLTSFTDVLTDQRTLLANQRDLAQSNATVATNLVSLYKALGGGWDAPELAAAAQARLTPASRTQP